MKLKAFSFLEVMFGLVLSVMVISAVYSVYIYSHQHFFKFNEVQSKHRGFCEFSSTVHRDVEQAKEIVKLSDYEVELKSINENILYEFEKDYTLRTINQHSDTFFLPISDIEYQVVNELDEKPLISYIEFTINESQLSFYKNYGAISLIEN